MMQFNRDVKTLDENSNFKMNNVCINANLTLSALGPDRAPRMEFCRNVKTLG
jgi:hypothetical protein